MAYLAFFTIVLPIALYYVSIWSYRSGFEHGMIRCRQRIEERIYKRHGGKPGEFDMHRLLDNL